MSTGWKVGVCDCWSPLSLCCGAFWCPCVIYGNTAQKRENPAGVPSSCSGSCGLYCAVAAFTGLQCILQCLNRQDLRRQYNIAGSGGNDFLLSYCCAPCSLVQERKEVDHQNSLRGPGGATAVPGAGMPQLGPGGAVGVGGTQVGGAPQGQGQGYQQQPQMAYGGAPGGSPAPQQQHMGSPPPPQGYQPQQQGTGMAYGEPGLPGKAQ